MNFTEIYNIYDTNMTSYFKLKHKPLTIFSDLTLDNWLEINDRRTENETLVITNTEGKKFVAARYFLNSMTPDVNIFFKISLKLKKLSFNKTIRKLKNKKKKKKIQIFKFFK